jgi:hypothetical protein
MNGQSISALLDEADQDRIRADLAIFFGQGGEPYLRFYGRMLAHGRPRRTSLMSWSWPAFLGGFAWFFYRKMYAVGTLLLLLPVLVDALIGLDASGAVVAVSLFAKSLYVQRALRRIIDADDLDLADEERRAFLARAGGVSPLAGLVAGAGYVCLIVIALLGVFGETEDFP